MASGLTTAERNRFLTERFKTLTIYGALFTADPGDAGAVANEVANSYDYARTEITCASDAAAGSISNTAATEFPVANGGAFGTVTHLGIATSNTWQGDTLIANGSLTASKTIADGDQIKFAIGNITVAIAAQA